MRHLWTKSSKWGSRLIRWGLDEDCSHYALEFFSERGDKALVIESRFPSGPRIRTREQFLKKNTLVHEVNYPLSVEDETNIFHDAIGHLFGLKYDFKAVLFFAYAAFLKKFFDVPLPRYNPWGTDTMAYCSEIIFLLDHEFDQFDFSCLDSDMISPHMTFELIIGDNDAICG